MKKKLLLIFIGILTVFITKTYAQDCLTDDYDVLQPYKAAFFASESYTRISSSDTGTMQDFLHSDFTMDFWIKPIWEVSSSDWQHVFNYGKWDDDENSFQVVFEPISGGWQIRITDGNDSGSNTDLKYEITDDEYTDNFKNKWTHIAVAVDFSTIATDTCEIELYINGESKQTQEDFVLQKYGSASSNYSNQKYCYLGNSPINDKNETFTGYLADFRLWTRVLSETQLNYLKDKMFESSNTFKSSYTYLAPYLLVNMIRSRTDDNIYSKGNAETIGMVEVDVAGLDSSLYPNAPAKPYSLEVTNTPPYDVELNWDNDTNGGTTYVYGKWSTEDDSAYELLCRTNTTTYAHIFEENDKGTYTFKILNAWHNYNAIGKLFGQSNGYTYSESITKSVNIGYTYMPDDNFEQALIDLGYDNMLDDYVLTENISSIKSLNVNSKSIEDLTGIEDFVALTYLVCDSNNLTEIDISNNINLDFLSCYNNQLTSLDVSTNTELYRLSCSSNQIEAIDISENLKLTYLGISDNNLNNLDVGVNTLLENLYCSSNSLTSLDVSANTALTTLSCYSNKLTSLDLSFNTALERLYCYSNALISLDVSANTALTTLSCYSNALTSLDVANGNNSNFSYFSASSNPNLTCIQVDDAEYSTTNWTSIDATASFSEDCHFDDTYVPDDNFEQALIDKGYDAILDDYVLTENISSLTYLNVHSKNIADLTGIEDFTALTTLSCYSNDLISLDVSGNTALTKLSCSSNNLASLNVSSNTSLIYLDCSSNDLPSLDVSSNTALTTLYCSSNDLPSLDVSSNTALTTLYCNSNGLTSLDVSANTALEILYCYSNELISLDVNSNTALTSLSCYSNSLTSLDVSANTALTSLRCNSNAITNLDVSTNTALTTLNCGANSLTSLDISSNTSLTDLNCYGNELTNLDVSSNLILRILACSTNGSMTFLNVSNNTELISLTCHYNSLTILDLDNNPNLNSLSCHGNALTSLNVANGNNSNFSSFSASGNPNLTCIQVDDAEYSTTNWTSIDATASFSEGCNSTLAVDSYDLESFKVYPNPSEGIVYVSVLEEATYQLVSLTGQVLEKGKLKAGRNSLDFTRYNKSMYFLTIKTAIAFHTEKLILE